MAKPTGPRATAGAGAQVPMPRVNVAKQTGQGKRSAPIPKAKLKLPKLPVNPKPRVPALLQPMGGGTGEENPQVIPRNSPKGVKQRVGIKNPMSAI